MSSDLEDGIDRLFAVPVGEFVAARDELARQARSDGDRDAADRIKALRKPTVSAHLVNRLARERELDVQRLLKAGEGLAAAQQGAAAGDAGDEFAEARREEQHALERLREAAQAIAAREGLGAGAVERAIQTLRAASVTGEGREQLKRGRLTEDLEPPGFEALLGMSPAPRARRKARSKEAPKAEAQATRRKVLAEARERVRTLQAEERELGTKATAAEREAERAEGDAAGLRAAAERARAEAQRAAERRADAERSLGDLRSEA